MPVRPATKDDLPTIAGMGSSFFGHTRYARFAKPDEAQILDIFDRIFEHGAIFVAEIDGAVAGFIACVMHGAWFDPNFRIALETAWWMHPDARGRPEGVRLLFAFEQWAKEHDAHAICMSDISLDEDSPAGKILERLGYQVSERTFIKELTNVRNVH
jgi:GNAT superfamily N-acetyltransferase